VGTSTGLRLVKVNNASVVSASWADTTYDGDRQLGEGGGGSDWLLTSLSSVSSVGREGSGGVGFLGLSEHAW